MKSPLHLAAAAFLRAADALVNAQDRLAKHEPGSKGRLKAYPVYAAASVVYARASERLLAALVGPTPKAERGILLTARGAVFVSLDAVKAWARRRAAADFGCLMDSGDGLKRVTAMRVRTGTWSFHVERLK